MNNKLMVQLAHTEQYLRRLTQERRAAIQKDDLPRVFELDGTIDTQLAVYHDLLKHRKEAA